MIAMEGLMRFLGLLFLLFVIPFLSYQSTWAAQPGDCTGKIAFVANVDGNWDLFIVDEDGQNQVRLTNTPYDEGEPC